MMISPGVFYLWKFFFLVVIGGGGVKGQKIAQNEKQQLHASRTISQGLYSLWSRVLVHLCKMMMSPGAFTFLIFSFFGLLGGKRTKNSPRWQKESACCRWYLRNHIYYMSFMVHLCKMIMSLGFFFIFSKLLFFGL